MARMPYTNFHDINLDWIIKRVMKAFTPDNPPDYPVKSVNSKTGHVVLDSDDIQDLDSGLDLTDALRKKQNRPESVGTAGQVLGLDNQLQPVWLNQPAPGVSDYDDLTGRPKINNVTLSGEMDGADLGLLDAPAAAGSQGQVLTSDGQGGQTWQTLPTPPQPLAGDYAPVIMDSASGPVASFPDGADGLDMAALVAEIIPTQSGSGDPSPNNIRPISGRGGITVYHTGANAWDEETESGSLSTIDGSDIVNANIIRTKNYIPVVSNATYMFVTSDQLWVVFFDDNKNIITSGLPSGASSSNNARNFRNGYSCLMPANCKYIRWYFRLEYGTTYKNDTSLNYPATDTAYHAYQGEEPILEAWGDVAGTVYGGTIDIVSGVLTVNRLAIDLGILAWLNYQAENSRFYANITALPPTSDNSYTTDICSIYKSSPSGPANLPNGQIKRYNSGSYRYLYICDTRFSDASQIASALSGQLFVGTLVTPVTYQLTAQQVQTIIGQNNIYSDSGDCSVTYRADTKLFILKVIA